MTFGLNKGASNLRNMAVGVKKPLRHANLATGPFCHDFRIKKSSFEPPQMAIGTKKLLSLANPATGHF
jgi:hypothetical protein